MRSLTRFAAGASLAALLAWPAPAQAPTPGDRAILNAANQLEKALAVAGPSDQKKLKEAIAFLKELARGNVKTDNHKLLDFNDEPAAYKGKTLTFEMQIAETAGDGLREFNPDRPTVTLVGKAGNPPATVKVVVDYREIWSKVVNAHTGDRVVVTFLCTSGDLKSGNLAKSITRP